MEWLLGQRDIAGLGTECIDVELGWKTKNEVKLQLAAANKISLVQVKTWNMTESHHKESLYILAAACAYFLFSKEQRREKIKSARSYQHL